jgi:hypothetical protein
MQLSTAKSIRIFLVGAERSGTTLLRLLLDHHPRVAWLNEFEYAVDLMTEDGWPDLRTYRRWLETHRVFQSTGFTINRWLDYPSLLESFFAQKHARCGKAVVGATVHRHFDRLLSIWPQAKFVHLVRDGRNVAQSCIGMGWAGNVWTGSRRWLEAERLWDRIKAKVPAPRRHEVRFEELLERPEEVLTGICEFIGVEFDAAMLEIESDTTYRRPSSDLASDWSRSMRDHDVRLLEACIGALLVNRGYSLSGLPPMQVGLLDRLRLHAQDRLARLLFRVRRYGWRLWAADVLSRRFGTHGWRRRVHLELNAVAAAHLK